MRAATDLACGLQTVMRRRRHAWACLLVLMPACGLAGAANDDDAATPASPAGTDRGGATLSAQQAQAVGLIVSHPVKLRAAQVIDAFGQVLDPGALVTDLGRLETARSNAHAAGAEALRLAVLYDANAEVSLKALQAAQAARAEAEALAQSSQVQFSLQWGPVARLAAGPRQRLVDASVANRIRLLRADVPGHYILGTVPQTATLEVDGVLAPARVLGLLQRSQSELPGVSVLLEAEQLPPEVGPGARVPVQLRGANLSGVLIPASALLYGAEGAYVYRQFAGPSGRDPGHYMPVTIKLLQSVGQGWLVAGLEPDDLIVTNGAGVLWSLQGIGSFSAEEADHD